MSVPSTIVAAGAALRAGTVTSQALTEHFLARIERYNPTLGAVVTTCSPAALEAAGRADDELRDGVDRGPLHGIPVAVKDIFATVDAPTSAQSAAMWPGYEGYDAAAVASLRQAGAVIVAKAACSEFACGGPDPTGPYALPRNPWDLDRWAGGSSGGTASGIAAGFFLGGLGSDTGGSIRIPAAYCGVTGLKPTFGLVPRRGCVPLAESMDHVGPMARSARDCALLLSVVAGQPADGVRGSWRPGIGYASQLTGHLEGLRIGVNVHDHVRAGAAPDSLAVLERALSVLTEAGAKVWEMSLPYSSIIYAATRAVINVESLTTHAPNLRERWSDYGRPTRLTLSTGSFYSARDYVQAQRILRSARRAVSEVFSRIDCFASLTCPFPAWRFAEMGLRTELTTPMLTRQWSGLGLPAVSFPIGAVRSGDAELPVGMQAIGPGSADARVLQVADAYQARTDWHLRTPPLFAPGTAASGAEPDPRPI